MKLKVKSGETAWQRQRSSSSSEVAAESHWQRSGPDQPGSQVTGSRVTGHGTLLGRAAAAVAAGRPAGSRRDQVRRGSGWRRASKNWNRAAIAEAAAGGARGAAHAARAGGGGTRDRREPCRVSWDEAGQVRSGEMRSGQVRASRSHREYSGDGDGDGDGQLEVGINHKVIMAFKSRLETARAMKIK